MLARELHCRLYRTSVKEDLNVRQVFQYLAEKYLSQLDALDDYCTEPPRSITIGTRDCTCLTNLWAQFSCLQIYTIADHILIFIFLNKILTDAFVPHSGNGFNGHQDTKVQRFQRWASRLPHIVDRDTIRLQPSNRKNKIIITKNKLKNACSFWWTKKWSAS